MARRSTPGRREPVSQPHPEIKVDEIWVTSEPHGRPLRDAVTRVQIGWPARLAGGIVVACTAVAVILAVVLPGGHSGAHTVNATQAPGERGIAAAYEYPFRCLTTTPAIGDPQWARVRLYRGSPCWRYGVWETVVVHRFAGAWHLVFDRAGYSCPVHWIPLVVQRQLGVCPPEGP